ncbi:hypothetical protein FQN60_017528, partial [Etheostoma spectabile]
TYLEQLIPLVREHTQAAVVLQHWGQVLPLLTPQWYRSKIMQSVGNHRQVQMMDRNTVFWLNKKVVHPGSVETQLHHKAPGILFGPYQQYHRNMSPKKAKKRSNGAGSNVFSMFEQAQIQEFKEMLTEAPGPVNFTVFLTMFGEKLKGADPEETILNAFKVFDPDGKGTLKKDFVTEMLTTQADRFSPEEMEQMFAAFPPDVAGNLDYNNLVHIITHGEEKDQE